MMQASDVEQRIKSYILTEVLQGSGDPQRLTSTTPLITSGILDSIARLRFVAFLDKEFSISLQAHEVVNDNFNTIERIARLVSSKLK
jgi:acyl carrier protein